MCLKLGVTLREEPRLGLFENRVLRMPKSEKINRILMKMRDDFPLQIPLGSSNQGE
jgi:hypothetical protein